MKTDAIWQATVQQCVFRELVEAFSRPGDIRNLSPWVDGSSAQRTMLATLMDGEITLADPHEQIAKTDWPLLQAKSGPTETARYLAANGHYAPDFQPALGTLESPEFGSTILIEIDCVGQGAMSLELTGPGIVRRRTLYLAGLHPDWLTHRSDWTEGFPLGVDLVLSDATRIVALPRTTRITLIGESVI